MSPILEHRTHMQARMLSEGHIKRRVYDLQRYEKWLGKPILDSTPEDIARWQTAVTERRATARSVYTELTQIRAFFTWAVRMDLIPKDPCVQGLTMPRLPRLLPRPMSENDLDVAIRCAPERIKPWLILAAYAGLRCCEISRLQRSDVVEAGPQSLLILRGKGGHDRVVPASERVMAALLEYGMPSSGYVFTRRDGRHGPITPHRISCAGNQYLHGLGITDTMHQIRHRFGTVLYQTSNDLRLTQEMMGHSDPASTAGYAAFDVSKTSRALAAVSGV